MTEPTIGGNSELAIDYDDVEKFLNEVADKAKSVSEANGTLRSTIKNNLATTGWHKGAVAMVRQIDNMSESARADFLRTFEPMYTVMMEKKWEDESRDILADEQEKS